MIKKFGKFFRYIEEILCASLLIIMVAISSINIITRYIPLGISFAASEELIVNLFVWLTMLGAVIAIKHRSHISITFITRKVPEKYQHIFLLVRWFSVLLVFAFLCFYGTIETWAEYRSGMMTYSLGWPFWFFTLSLPVGSLLFLFRFSQLTYQELKLQK